MKTMSYIFTLLISISLSTALDAHDRTEIVEDASQVSPILIGETIPSVTLFDSDGKPVNLLEKAAEKPTILLFYRGGWCPFCNAQLSQIQEVESQIKELGYQLLAISPDTPDALKMSIEDRKLDYQLISDFNLQATRQFGLGFYIPKKYSDLIAKHGGKTQALESDERSVLPVPAVFILDKEGVIKFEYVNPNFRVRIQPELLLKAAELALEE